MSWPFLALYAVVRGVIFSSILLLIGSQMAARLITAQLYAHPDFSQPLHSRLRLMSRWVVVILGVAVCLKGALQVLSLHDPGDPITGDFVKAVLLDNRWGHSWLVQLGAIYIFSIWWRSATALTTQLPAVAVALIAAIVWAQTGMGHAAGNKWPGAIPIGRLLDAAHLLGLGIWLGTLAAMGRVAFPLLHGEQRLPLLARVVRAFSLYARVGVTLVIASGTIAALVYAGPIARIPQSTWGRLLMLKLALMLGVLALGWYNWRVVTPALDGSDATARQRLRFAVGFELLLGLTMLIVTAFLVASALPGEG